MVGEPYCEFVEGWVVTQVLGEGAFGEVRLLVNVRSGESVALKTIRANEAGELEKKAAAKEAALHMAMRHPNVLRCLGRRVHQGSHYMFLEYAQGGELFDRIEPDIGMSEKLARRYWRQLLTGLSYLHKKGVAHRDIKPENLLLDAQDNIKISDFGMATVFRYNDAERFLNHRCGTLPYAAPEVLIAAEAPYRAEPADLWSAAVVLVAMLAGALPWEQASMEIENYSLWCMGKTMGRPWDKIRAQPLALIRRMLSREPQRRPKLPDLLNHPWLVDHQDAVDSKLTDRGWCSQPPSVNVSADSATANELSAADMDSLLSFSQPAVADDLLLSQHSPNTQTQSVLQRLVRRMTRVWVRVDENEAIAALCEALRARGDTWQRLHPTILAINCGRVGMRAWAVRAAGECGDSRVLLEFRRSRGCGLEFKRAFLKLRSALQDISSPPPVDARLDLLAPPVSVDKEAPMDQS